MKIFFFNKTRSQSSDGIVCEFPSIFDRQTQQILQFQDSTQSFSRVEDDYVPHL